MKKTTAKCKPKVRMPPELKQLELVVGQFIEYWGFKRIHGRIWAHLYTSARPMTSQELMDRLAVSKGLMSLAIRELLEHRVIRETHTGRYGSVYYETNPDLWAVITTILRSRENLILASTKTAAEGLLRLRSGELEAVGICPEKVRCLLNLTSSAQELLSLFLMNGGSDNGALFEPLTEHHIREKD